MKQIAIILMVLMAFPIAMAMKEPTIKIDGGDGSSYIHGGWDTEERQIDDPEIPKETVGSDNAYTSHHGAKKTCSNLLVDNKQITLKTCFKYLGIDYTYSVVNFDGFKVIKLYKGKEWIGTTGINSEGNRLIRNFKLSLCEDKICMMAI